MYDGGLVGFEADSAEAPISLASMVAVTPVLCRWSLAGG
jgi:hypothetical protein